MRILYIWWNVHSYVYAPQLYKFHIDSKFWKWSSARDSFVFCGNLKWQLIYSQQCSKKKKKMFKTHKKWHLQNTLFTALVSDGLFQCTLSFMTIRKLALKRLQAIPCVLQFIVNYIYYINITRYNKKETNFTYVIL